MPELELWGTQLTHVIYDTSPIPNPPHPSDAEYQQKVQHGEYLILRSVLKGYVYTEGSTTEKFSVLYVPKRSEDDVKAASLFGDENEEVRRKLLIFFFSSASADTPACRYRQRLKSSSGFASTTIGSIMQ